MPLLEIRADNQGSSLATGKLSEVTGMFPEGKEGGINKEDCSTETSSAEDHTRFPISSLMPGPDSTATELTGHFDEISRRVAALADEKNNLIAQLRQTRSSHRPGHVTQTSHGLDNKENLSADDRHEAAQKSVRFSSPLLTPKSKAWAGEVKSRMMPEVLPKAQDAEERARQAVEVLMHDTRTIRELPLRIEPENKTSSKETSVEPGAGVAHRWQRLLAESNERNEELSRELAHMTLILQTKDMEMDRMRQQQRTSEEHSSVLLAELGASTRSLHDLRLKASEAEQTRNELDAARSTIMGLKKELEMAHDQQQRLEQERCKEKAELESRVGVLQEELVAAGRELVRQAERAKHAVALDGMLGEECRRLEDALNKATADADKLRDTCAKLSGERDALSTTCSFQLAVIKELSEAANAQQQESRRLTGVESRLVAAESDAVTAKVQLAHALERCSDMEKERERLVWEGGEAKLRADEAQDKCSEADEEIHRCKEELSRLNAHMVVAARDKSTLEAQLQQAQGEQESLKGLVCKLQSDVECASKEAEERMSSMTQRLDALQKELQAKAKDLNDREQGARGVHQQLVDLTQRLAEDAAALHDPQAPASKEVEHTRASGTKRVRTESPIKADTKHGTLLVAGSSPAAVLEADNTRHSSIFSPPAQQAASQPGASPAAMHASSRTGLPASPVVPNSLLKELKERVKSLVALAREKEWQLQQAYMELETEKARAAREVQLTATAVSETDSQRELCSREKARADELQALLEEERTIAQAVKKEVESLLQQVAHARGEARTARAEAESIKAELEREMGGGREVAEECLRLAEEIEGARCEVNELLAERERLEKQLHECERLVLASRQQNEETVVEMESVMQKLQALQEEHKEERTMRESAQAGEERETERARQLEIDKECLTCERDELVQRAALAEDCARQLAHAKIELGRVCGERDSLSTKLALAEAELERMDNDTDALRSDLEASTSRCDELVNECQVTKERCDELQQECQTLKSTCEELKSTCEELGSECQQLQDKCQSLEEQLCVAEAQLDALKCDVKASHKTIQGLQEDIETSRQECEALQACSKECDKLRKASLRHEKDAAEQDEQLQASREEVSRLNRLLGERAATVKDATAASEALTREIKGLEAAAAERARVLADTKAKLAEVQADFESETTKTDKLVADKCRLQGRVNELEEENQTLTEQAARSTKAAADSTRQMKQLQQRCAELEEQVAQSNAERMEIESELSKLRGQASRLERNAEDVARDKDKLMAQIKVLADDKALLLRESEVFDNERSAAAERSNQWLHERSALLHERDALAIENKATNDAMEKLVNERGKIESERDAAVSERDAAVSERDAAVSERDAVLIERDALVIERDELQTRMDVIVSQADALANENNALIVEVNQLECETDALKRDQAQLVSERDDLMRDRDQLVSERDAAINDSDGKQDISHAVQSERDAAIADRDALYVQNQELSQVKDEFEQDNRLLRDQQTSLMQERNALVQERDALVQERDAFAAKYAEAEESRLQLQARVAEETERAAQMGEDAAEARARLVDVKGDLDKAVRESMILTRKVQQAEAAIEDAAKRGVESALLEVDELLRERDELRESLRHTNNECAMLRDSLALARESMADLQEDAHQLSRSGGDVQARLEQCERDKALLRRECAALVAREQELQLLMAEREAEAARAMQDKEAHIVDFLRAVEAKTLQREDDLERARAWAKDRQEELEETRTLLARTEAALAKVLQLRSSPLRD